jgi:hypothetical protein
MSSPRASLVLVGLLAACLPARAPEHSAPERVVLVVLDAWRADRVGALGHQGGLTPRLDALAAEGVLFERAYAASSFGLQALSALWTGRLPSEGGSTGTEAAPHPELDTLPRLFRRAGYRTALVTNFAPLRARGFTRGFDELEIDSVAGRWDAARVTAKALELAAGEGSLFLVVDYADAGEPHDPPAERRERIGPPVPVEPLTLDSLRAQAGALPPDLPESPGFRDLVARYEAEVAEVDRALEALVDGLAAHREAADTLLVVTASHGLEFLEHGYVGSGWTLHEEVLRVPLVVHAPARLAPARVGAPVSLADLFPTLQRLLAPALADAERDARALLVPSGSGLAARAPEAPVLAELVLPELTVMRTAIRGETKLVEVLLSAAPGERLAWLAGHRERLARLASGEAQRLDPLGPAAQAELFDLADDPGETRARRSTGADDPALAAVLAGYLERCRARGKQATELPPPALDAEPASLEELRQIGYL